MATTVANLEVKISFDDSELAAGVAAAGRHLDDFGQNAKRLKSILGLQTANILAGFGRSIGDAFKGVVKASADLETAVARTAIIRPTLDISDVTRKIEQLSLKVPVATADIAASFEVINSAINDVSVDLAVKKAAEFSQIAKALKVDYEDFTNSVVGAGKSFNITLENSRRVTDSFIEIISQGTIKGHELARTYSTVAKQGQAAGVSFDQLSAAIIASTQSGGNAFTAMQDLGNVLNKLPLPQTVENLKGLGAGVAVFDNLTGKLRPLFDIFRDIREQTKGMDDETRKAALASVFPDVEAQRGAFTLIQNLEAYRKGLIGVQKTSGQTANAIKVSNSTFASQAQLLQNAFDAVRRAFGDEIIKELRPLILVIGKELPGHIRALRGFLESIPAPVKRFAVVFGVLLAALAPVITVIAGIGFAVATVGAWPIAVAAAVTAVVALIVSNWSKIRDFTVSTWNALVKSITDGSHRFSQGLNDMVVSIKVWWFNLQQGFSRAWESIRGFFSGLGRNLVGAVLSGLRSVAPLLFGGLAGIAMKLVETVQKVLGIKSPSKVFHGIGQNVGQGLADGVRQSAPRVRRSGQEITEQALAGIKDAPKKFKIIGNEMANGMILGLEGRKLITLPVAEAQKRLREQTQKGRLTEAQKDERRAIELIGRFRAENAELTRNATEAEAGYVASVRLASQAHREELRALVSKNEALKNQQSLKQRFTDIVESLRQQIEQISGGEKAGRDLTDFSSEQQKVIRGLELQLQKTKDLMAEEARREQAATDLAQSIEATLADERLKIQELTGATEVHTLAVSLLGKTWLKADEATRRAAISGAAEILVVRQTRKEIEALREAEREREEEIKRTSSTLLNSLNNARAEYARLTATTSEQTVALDLVNKGYFDLTEEQRRQVQEVIRLTKSNEALREARKAEAEEVERQKTLSRQLVNFLDDQVARMRELLGLESFREKVIARLNLGTKNLTLEQQKAVDQAVANEKFIQQAERTQNTIKQVAERVGTVFGQSLNRLQEEGFGTFFGNILHEFENLLIEMAQELLKSEFIKLLKGLGTRILQPAQLPQAEAAKAAKGDALQQAVSQNLGAFAGGKDPLKDALELQKQTIAGMQAGGGNLANPASLLGGQFGFNLAQGAGPTALIDKLVGGPSGQGGVAQSIGDALGKAGTDVGSVLAQAITTSGGDLANTATGALQSGGSLVATAITSTGAAGLTTSLAASFTTGGVTLSTTLAASFAAGAATLAAAIASASAAGGAAGAASGVGGLLGFAGGGRVGGGSPILVGERGPEVFLPRSGGTIVPNDQLGGQAVNITFNIQTPDVAGFQRSQSQLVSDAMRTAEVQRRRNG